MLKKSISLNLVTLALFTADRILKFWFSNNPAFSRDFIDNFLSFRFEVNSGIAFGVRIDRILLLFLVISIIFVLFGLLFRAYRESRPLDVFSVTLIVVGAISNLIDRLRFGFVVDYINVPFFTVFNLADVMITVGVFFLAVGLFSNKKNSGQNYDI